MSKKIAEQVFADARANFIYTPDGEQFDVREDWRSHAGEIEGSWRDDCDGFAITCAELLIERGVPKENVKLIYCKTETGTGHLVCGVDADGDTLILDNRQRAVWGWETIRYEWLRSMRASEPGEWREAAGP